MKKFAIIIATTGLCCIAFAASWAASAHAPFALSDAESSPDALVKRLIAALEKKDEAALQSIRVNEREYREIIGPGTVPPGQPPRQTSESVSQFYWSMVDAKSRDLGRVLLNRFGGRKLEIEKIEYSKAPQDYAWYRATGEVRVHVKNAEGEEAIVPAGWIAEVDGRYKFIGINWND